MQIKILILTPATFKPCYMAEATWSALQNVQKDLERRGNRKPMLCHTDPFSNLRKYLGVAELEEVVLKHAHV